MDKTAEICPHCGKSNPQGGTHCYACGHILLSALRDVLPVETTQLDDVVEALEPRRRWGTAYFNQESRLQFTMRETGEVLLVKISGELTVGRAHEVLNAPQPDVDLSKYEAFEKGVSRVHAVMRRDHDTISVSDLGSANGTYLNNQRILPYEVRILRDNDDLRLGRLVIRVTFV